MIKQIIEENERRKRIMKGEFDPVSGAGSIGKRFQLDLPDFFIPRQWLPEAMRRESLVEVLIETGSIKQTAKRLCGRATKEETSFINDCLIKLRARHDFPFWAAMFAYIKQKGGGEDILFRLNRPQRMFVERLESARLNGRPIRMILLKARQWGGSTCSQLYMAWLQLLHRKGLNSLIIAHQGSGSDEIKDMFDRMIAAYPEEMLYDSGTPSADRRKHKMETVGKSRSIFRVGARNCKIKIGTAERPDSCRGGDYNLVHCSEVGIWKATAGKTPEMIVRSACSGILFKPQTMIVYESTANGTGNFFQREYVAAKRGESQFESLFISWFDIEQYSLPLDNPEEFAAELIENRNCETSASDRTESGRYLWWLWEKGATLEAINWYIAERAKFGSHGLMASEYPSDDIEAFVHSGARVFDKYLVERLRNGCRNPRYVGEMTGFPDNVQFTPMENGALKIWNMPEIDSAEPVSDRYLVVVDIGGRGQRADWSVIAVFDRMYLIDGERPVIAAQWRGHTDMDRLAVNAAAIASFYDNALLVIESNTAETRGERNADGAPYIFTNLNAVYNNLYRRRVAPEHVGQSLTRRYGFHTNTNTKPMIIAELIRAVREGLYIERDTDCIEELLTYEQRPNGSYGAIPGAHDDILMTRAIGLYISGHEMPLPALTSKTKYHKTNESPSTEATIS